MKDKYYNLTEKPNEGKRDNAPEWMNTLFENGFKTEKTSGKPFEGINDSILNPTNNGVNKTKKCNVCGAILKPNEVGVCSKCL